MKQKLSDYVADFLARQGLRHVFVVTGGASIHLLHSLHNAPGIAPICVHHEQAGAMAADAYARVTGLGCAIATSGPGATNMITGIAGAWFDSVPVLYITGQVASFRMKGATGVRQFGFQETDIVSMVAGITKRAIQLNVPEMIRYELERAVAAAQAGRLGPVLLDIPDDFQRAIIDTDDLNSFVETIVPMWPSDSEVSQTLGYLQKSERPVMVLGAGVRLAGAYNAARILAIYWRIPVLTTWGVKDLFPADQRLNIGTFGQDGTRYGNFTMQNADCVLAIGARLSTRETGALPLWARGANTIVVDIDQAELDKFATFGRLINLGICTDAGAMIEALSEAAETWRAPDWSAWRADIKAWQTCYPITLPAARAEQSISPYVLMEELSTAAPDNAQFFVDTGSTVAWAMQALRLKPGQRIYHDCNNTAMGWALPAAIGGALAAPERTTICLVGDGSLMFNLQELATIREHNLPIKIILLDNAGYGMVRQTEDQWLAGKHVGTSTESGLGFPDFCSLVSSFGISVDAHDAREGVPFGLSDLFQRAGPGFLSLTIPPAARVTPKVAFGRPIEDGEPYLPRDEFLAQMRVPPLQVSLDVQPDTDAA